MNDNFTSVKPLCYWVQHVLPLVYDDSLSYMELLGRVTKRINELIENNNKLPDYIMELIREYISSGEIEKVLAEVLANYMLNVKFPPTGLTPATGDGSTDDTEAIQGCIDYAYNNGGMSVYFPSGSYLTQPLTLRNKATLFGQDRYTTRLVMKGGATTAMFTGDVDELTLSGLGFDGNMDIQVNNVNLFTISVNSAIISNCLLTDGYDLLNITVNNDLQLNNLLFRHAVENALFLKGNGLVQGENLIFKSVSTLVGKNFVVMDVSKSILEQVKCYGASPNGVLINGNNNVVKMWNEQSLTPFVDNGINNSVTVYTDSEVEKLTGSKTAVIDGDDTETITGNKAVSAHDITETANGVRTENTTGNRNETTGGNLVEKTEGNATETVTGDKVVSSQNYNETVTGDKVTTTNKSTETVATEKDFNANVSRETLETKTVNVSGVNTENSGSKNETITGDKVVKVANSTETVEGDKTVNAGDISNTAASITNHATRNLTEQVDGNRTNTVKGNDTEIITGNKSFNTTNLVFNTVNPISYSHEPKELNRYFKYIPFSYGDDEYQILVNKNFKGSIINVKDFGAIGDGITDDLPSFKSAVAESKKNDIIFIPPGNYFWKYSGSGDNLLYIPHNILFEGCGASSVIVFDRNTPTNVNIIEWNVEKGVDNQLGGFRNFYANYNGSFSDTHFAGNNLIYINGTDPQTHISMCLIERIRSVGFSGYGVYLDNPSGTDCFFLSTIQFCLFYGGIYLQGCGDSVNILFNNFTKGNDNYGIYCDFVEGSACSIIQGNNLTSPKENIFIFNGEQVKVIYNQIEQKSFNGSTESPVFLSKCSKVLFMSNNVNAHNNCAYNVNMINCDNCDLMLNVLNNAKDKAISVGEGCKNTGEFKNVYNRKGIKYEWDIYNNGVLTEHAITPLSLTNCTPYLPEQYGTPSFYLENNKIYFKGVLNPTALAANTSYFTLPVGYRPNLNSALSLSCGIKDSDVSTIVLIISGDGTAKLLYTKENLGLIFLDGACIELYQ